MEIYLYQNETQTGPFTEEAIADQLRSGKISSGTFAWHEGLAEWKGLQAVLSGLFESAVTDPEVNNSRQVRVFISSTFRDMHAERDHLVTVVFPELRERCERLGLEFFDVELRWGVPEKGPDGEQANSWEYFHAATCSPASQRSSE